MLKQVVVLMTVHLYRAIAREQQLNYEDRLH